MALQWIQSNIHKFGGDPNRVTLFGQSAGACFTVAHLVSEQSKGLFTSAIIQSGISTEEGWLPVSLVKAQKTGISFVANVGCSASIDIVSCLRSASIATLLKAQASSSSYYWTPVIDGVFIKDAVEKLIAAGQFHHIPIMIGANKNDTSLGVAIGATYLPFKSIYNWEYDVYIGYEFGLTSVAHNVKERYPYNNFNNGAEALGAITNDQTIMCFTGSVAKSLALYNHAPVYLYEFAYYPKSNGIYKTNIPLGAYHGAEIAYVFNNIHLYNPEKLTQDDLDLASFMSASWIEFATSSRFNTESYWKPYNNITDLAFFINSPSNMEMKSFGSAHQCDFWDKWIPQIDVKYYNT